MFDTMRRTRHARLTITMLIMVACFGAFAGAAVAATPPALTDTTSANTHTATVGDTVTLTQGTFDDGGTPVDSWYDCDSATPSAPVLGMLDADCTAITPTTATTYTVTDTDLNAYPNDWIVVFESDSSALGSLDPPVASNALAVAAAPPPPPPPPSAPVNTAPPSISGSTVVGSTLTADPGRWSGAPSYSYEWLRCAGKGKSCAETGVTATTYTLTSADLDDVIELFVTATATANDQSASTTYPYPAVSGTVTKPVGKPPPPVVTPPPGKGSSLPTIGGTPQLASTLTATPVTLSNNPTSYGYQWMRCTGQSCTAIAGATGTLVYTPTDADLGDELMFSETASNAGGSASVASATTAAVTAPSQTALLITPGVIAAGQPATLVATVSSATASAPPAGAVTFELAGVPISGCTQLPTNPSGAGATVTCRATFPASDPALSALYTPASGALVTGSDSSAVGYVVGQAASTDQLSGPRTLTVGRSATYTAQIFAPAGTGLTPTGTVVFVDDKKPIKGCTIKLVRQVARCKVTYPAVGAHKIAAVYFGDSNFSSSSSKPINATVAEPGPTGVVSALMTWRFSFAPKYTRVLALNVTGLSPGVKVSLGCSGKGCPLHQYSQRIAKPAKCHKHHKCAAPTKLDLGRQLGRHRLKVGSTLTVRITHRGWLGKYYRFTIRRGREPKITTTCLGVGDTKPSAASCAAR